MGNSCSPGCRLWCLMASFVLSFFPLDVLDGIWDLIESVSEGLLTYSPVFETNSLRKDMVLYNCYVAILERRRVFKFTCFTNTFRLLALGVVRSSLKRLFLFVVVLLFYVHGKHRRPCRDGQLT